MEKVLSLKSQVLTQRLHGGLDALAGFDEAVFGGGVGEADAVVVAEGGALDGGDAAVQQEVEGQVGGVLDDRLVVLGGKLGVGGDVLAKEAAHLREEVEGALRQGHFEAGNLLQQAIDQVAAFEEGVAHGDNVLGSFRIHLHGPQRGALRDGARGGRDLTLQLVASLGHIHGGADEADTPAGHGKTFRHTVHRDHLIFDKIELGNALMTAHEVDVLVNLVRHNHHLRVLGHHLSDGAKFLLGVDHARRIRRAAEHHQFGLRGDSGFELRGSNLEVVLDFAGDILDVGLCHLRDGAVGNPVGSGDDDLIAGIHQSHNSLIDGLFTTGGNHNLLRRVVQTVVSLELVADGFQEVRIAGHGRIVREVVVDGLFGVFLHRFRRVEIGLADAQADHILTFVL